MLTITQQNINNVANSLEILKRHINGRFSSETQTAIQPYISNLDRDITDTKKSLESDLALIHQGVESLKGLTNPPFENDFAAQKLDVENRKNPVDRAALASFNAGALAENGRMIGAFRDAIDKIVKEFFSPNLAA